MHFSLLQNAFLLTAECISPYCNWSLKDPAHHIPNQTEIATKELSPKSLLRKQNEIDFIESHFQILHHLKIVHKVSSSIHCIIQKVTRIQKYVFSMCLRTKISRNKESLDPNSQPQVYARDPSRQHSGSHSHRRASFEKNFRKITVDY